MRWGPGGMGHRGSDVPMRILAIARNTFRENIRDKILYNLILFALIMILSSIALGQLTLGLESKMIIDLGLTSVSVFGTLIAIFIGISLVYKELEKRTVYALLAKPVHRWEFIVGKYLGLLFTLLVNLAIMTIGIALTLLYQGGTEPGTYVRLLTPPAEGRVVRGDRGLRVGQMIRVRLLRTDPYNAFIDFERVG